jgi:protein O-GlcNAc transferase
MSKTELDQALAYHQEGRLNEAEALYREILAREPVHAEALNLLGILSAQQGDARGEVYLIEKAIAQLP